MERLVVIANPVASQFTGGSHRVVMSTLSKTHNVEALWPATPGEATDVARHAVEEDDVRVVVAMGGDGMVHHVAQGLVGTKASLGVIPVGTTNVVARLLGMPSRPARAARAIGRSHSPSTVGVATMTLHRGTTETTHHAMFSCGVGLDAQVVIEADSDPYRKYRFGSIHYARTAFGVGLRDYPKRQPNLEITAGDRTATGTTVVVQFRDVYTYFGKMPITLGKEKPDPMTALVLGRLKRRRIPRIAWNSLTKRNLADVEDIDVWESVGSIDIEADPPVAAQADGESLGMADSAQIRWTPDALNVIGASVV